MLNLVPNVSSGGLLTYKQALKVFPRADRWRRASRRPLYVELVEGPQRPEYVTTVRNRIKLTDFLDQAEVHLQRRPLQQQEDLMAEPREVMQPSAPGLEQPTNTLHVGSTNPHEVQPLEDLVGRLGLRPAKSA